MRQSYGRTKPRRIPITLDELIKIYKDNGLEAEILKIRLFKKMEEKYDNMQIKMVSSSVGLNIWNIERKIVVAISSNPNSY